MSNYPKDKEPDLIDEYPGLVKSGSGLVWDDVLEMRQGKIKKQSLQDFLNEL